MQQPVLGLGDDTRRRGCFPCPAHGRGPPHGPPAPAGRNPLVPRAALLGGRAGRQRRVPCQPPRPCDAELLVRLALMRVARRQCAHPRGRHALLLRFRLDDGVAGVDVEGSRHGGPPKARRDVVGESAHLSVERRDDAAAGDGCAPTVAAQVGLGRRRLRCASRRSGRFPCIEAPVVAGALCASPFAQHDACRSPAALAACFGLEGVRA
mmetsp:Transcript_246/g.487  ORF Transcript_246/g.487 Transcript_246/m.487 type:complete len:209 (+) Transcript_246:131-757(+)